MTAQHAPRTPLWRQILSLPHTRLGWWAVGLLISFVLLVVADPLWTFLPARGWVGDALELLLLITGLVVTLACGFVGTLALGAGERSLLVWLAQAPPAILFAFALNLFNEGSPWGRASVGVLIWAFMAFCIYWPGRVIFRGSRERSP